MPTIKYLNSQKGFIHAVLFLVVFLVLIGIILVAFVPKVIKMLPNLSKIVSLKSSSQNKTDISGIPATATGNRVRGNAGEIFPYGDIQEDKIYESQMDSEGGVMRVDLAKNVRAYLIVPPNYTGFGGNVFSITPYFSMPTSAEAPALPDTLGYGLDFEIQGEAFDNIAPLYLVFDLDQGETVKQIMKNPKLSTYCLPLLNTFNPAGCALLNNVPTSQNTNTKYAVVSPVRDKDYPDLMFMNSTIPIGYDNLIVVEITKQATYIPVPLSQDLLADLIHANRLGFTIPQIEALTFAINNNILYQDLDSYSNVYKYLYAGESPYDALKVMDILPKYKAYFEYVKAHSQVYVDKSNTQDYVNQSLDNIINDQTDLVSQAKADLNKYFDQESAYSSASAYTTLTAVLQLRRLEKENYEDAPQIRHQMSDKIMKDVSYFLDPGLEPDFNMYLMLESAMWANPEIFSRVKLTYAKPVSTRLALAPDNQSNVLGEEDSTEDQPQQNEYNTDLNTNSDYSFYGGDLTDQIKDLIDRATQEALYPLNNPCAGSFGTILHSMAVADLLGRTDIRSRLDDLFERRLLDDLKNNESATANEIQRECAAIMMTGLDEKYPCLDQFCEDKRKARESKLKCTTLMEKNLKNFANNEVKCVETGGGTPPKFPPDCGVPDKPSLCPQSE